MKRSIELSVFSLFILGVISVHSIATANACGRGSTSVVPFPDEKHVSNQDRSKIKLAFPITSVSEIVPIARAQYVPPLRRIDLRMLAELVHDMKTPLWAITGTAELVADDLDSEENPDYQTYFREILSSGELLITKINDILVKTRSVSKDGSSEPTDAHIDLAMLEKMTEPLKTISNTITIQTERLNTLAASENKTETYEEPIDTINAGNHALLQLIKHVSDLASLQGGTLKVTPTQFSLNQMLSRTRAIIQPLALSAKLGLQVEVNSSVPDLLVGDPEIISRIINNLVGNAINFTTHGSIKIYIDGKYDRDDFVLNVRIIDTGKGMSSVKRLGLFQPEAFMQADTDTTLKYASTGLGLSIVNKLCDLINGTVLAEKSVLGLGTTFLVTVKLPVWTPQLLPNQVNT